MLALPRSKLAPRGYIQAIRPALTDRAVYATARPTPRTLPPSYRLACIWRFDRYYHAKSYDRDDTPITVEATEPSRRKKRRSQNTWSGASGDSRSGGAWGPRVPELEPRKESLIQMERMESQVEGGCFSSFVLRGKEGQENAAQPHVLGSSRRTA